MNKIQNISRFFNWLFKIIFVALPVLYVVFWINAPTPIFNGAFPLSFIPTSISVMHPLSIATKLLGFAISLIPLTISLFILRFLISLFKDFSQGRIFSLRNTLLIRRIGFTLLIGQLINCTIYHALMSATLTWHNPPGHRMASITVSSMNLGILLTSLLIILISWIMAEAYKMKEEQVFTI